MPHETSMSAASRKAWNLKVVQRHDPDIICIWEQVSYVMLMQYSPTGWTKTAVEGSLFLFDRRGDPRYGFFILNRSSSQNYMHLLTAEDNLEVLESYVIFRAKGSKDAPVMGLWASDPEHRAHLGDVLLGLHAHIKSGSSEPYYDPEEVYGAQGQPAVSPPPPASTSSGNYAPLASNTPSRGPPIGDTGGMQSLNDLFARLTSSVSTNSVAPGPGTSQTPLYSTQPPTAVPAAPNNGSHVPPQPPIQPPPVQSGPLRGQALLDSLFAMASPTRVPAAPAQPVSNNLPISGTFTVPQPQPAGNFSLSPPTAAVNQPLANTQAPAPSKGGDLLAQLFANINSSQPTASSAKNGRPSTPPSAPPSALPPDPAIIHSVKHTPDHKKRVNTSMRDRRGYATDTSPRPHHYSHHHRMSVFTEDPTASEDGVGAGVGGSARNKPRAGRPLVPFQSDTGPVYHPDPTRPHVSNRFPAGENGEDEKVYVAGPGEEEAEDEIFYDGRGNGKGPSPKRQRRRKGGRGAKNGVNLDRGIAADVLMQGIEWDEGVVDQGLFLQSIHALLNEQEFVDQLYNDYKVAQARQSSGI